MAKILIVEDDKNLNGAYQLILKQAGHEVRAVYDGEQALKTVKRFPPHLILLDLLMPTKSGIEFLSEYNATHHTSTPKIIIFTNLENTKEIDDAFRLGAHKYFIKSLATPQALVKIVEDILASKEG